MLQGERSDSTRLARPNQAARDAPSPPADWQLPPGVTRALWEYAHEPSIADDYDAYFADNRLFRFDVDLLDGHFERPGRLLDLGCGTGRHLLHFARRGFRAVGVDLSHRMLVRARDKARREGLDIGCVEADLCRLDGLPAGHFDYAIAMFSTLGMIKGAENRARVVAHVHRLLKPGGLFAVHVHNRWYNLFDPQGRRWLLGDLARSWLLGRPAGDKELLYRGIPNMYIHVFTRGELVKLLRRAGFRITEIVPLATARDEPLRPGWLLPRLRANGYIALAERR